MPERPLRILLCTTPIRPNPTDYPPIGLMAVTQALRQAGYDPFFYDIDAFRPSFEEVERVLLDYRPDVIGISAVVSTAYAFTKKLSVAAKRLLPGVRVIVGGNLAASAEILHRLAGVDFCVIGEGETSGTSLIKHLDANRGPLDEAALSAVRGITFLERDGQLRFTGYEFAAPPEKLYIPDYDLLEKHSRIGTFITEPKYRDDFMADPRTCQPHRTGKRMAVLVATKGCVARCTFCHRWDKGFRQYPVSRTIEWIRLLKSRYNVNFFVFSDENFGSDRRWVDEFVREVAKEDILYLVGGVRVRSVNPDMLRRLRESGCVAVYYGIETGSPRILEVMEKKATQQDNVNAVRWTREGGLFTIYQLVLGMPGETDETIQETIDFMKQATEDLPGSPLVRISVNYIQALPGTPVYEFARHQGLIGRSLQDEESYLLQISDIEAADETKFVNFTGYDYLTVQSWRRKLLLEVTHHYRRRNEMKRISPFDILHDLVLRKRWPGRFTTDRIPGLEALNDYNHGGYFNLQKRNIVYFLISDYLYPLRAPLLWAWLLRQEFRRLPVRTFLAHVAEAVLARLRGPRPPVDYRSLRKVMEELRPREMTPTEAAMQPLREGR